jgi:dephospho-CoA kinase
LPAAKFFDADAAARELLDSDPETRANLLNRFGPGYFEPDGRVNRARLREAVFANESCRRDLEALMHPGIRHRWTALAQAARHQGDWLLVDIPLLYETGAEGEFDEIAVVACSEATQRARMVSHRGLTAEMADKIIASQATLAFKAAQADFVIWNEAPKARLEEQAELFAGTLEERYG